MTYTGLTTSADGWTFDNVQMPAGGSYVWSWKSGDYGAYLNGSAYIGGAAKEALSYAVSPEFDLTGIMNPKIVFDHAAKFQTTLREMCKISVRVAGTTEWKDYEIPNWPGAGTWTFASSGSISLEEFAGKKIQVAFKYHSSTAGADTWEIKNFVLSGLK